MREGGVDPAIYIFFRKILLFEKRTMQKLMKLLTISHKKFSQVILGQN
jgi:hypothetical protein